MKRYMIFCLAAALSVSCAKDAEVFEPGIEDTNAVRFTGMSEDTRVSYEDTGSAFKISWDAGDRVGFFARTAGEELRNNVAYTAAAAGATTDFSPEAYSERIRWADETTPHNFYAYSPFGEQAGTDPTAISVSIPAVQQQAANNDSSHLPALDFMYAGAEGLVKSDDPISLNFRHVFSVLDLHLPMKENVRVMLTDIEFTCTSNTKELVSFENGKIDLTTGRLDLSGATGSNSIRLECGFATSDLEDQHLFLMVTPGHAGETFEITATINGTKYLLATRTVPEAGLPAGKVVAVDAVLPEFDEEDLYRPDDLSAESPANCYIVNKAGGYYRFRADIKGNGVPRDLTYTANQKASSFTYTAEDLKIEPKAVVVLWYECAQLTKSKTGAWSNDCPIMLKTLALKSDGYIYFETPEEFVNGNIVIAVIDQDLKAEEIEVDPATRQLTNANILWSWNLICSEGYDLNDAAQQYTKNGYTFMARDLGAVVDADDTADAYTRGASQGNCYQWGSKNPIPHIPGYDSADVPYVTGLQFTPNFTTIPGLAVEGEQGKGGHVIPGQVFGSNDTSKNLCRIGKLAGNNSYSTEVAIDYMTRCPYLWLNGGDNEPYAWLKDTSNSAAMWGTPDGEMEVKTIFDPCPAGWKVPSLKAWKAFSDDLSIQLMAKVCYFNYDGLSFPIWGGRGTDSRSTGYDIGGWSGYRCTARYHSADVNDELGWYPRAKVFRIIADKGNYDTNPESSTESAIFHTAEGHRIRCVKENE